MFRRLPKLHNFDQVVTRDWVELNVGALSGLAANSEVSADSLVTSKILRKTTNSLRILGNGELKVALKITAHHFSAGAKAKIEAAGGTVTLIETIAEEGKRSKRLNKSIRKKETELKAAEVEKKNAAEAKEEKKNKVVVKAAPKEKTAKADKPTGNKAGANAKTQKKK